MEQKNGTSILQGVIVHAHEQYDIYQYKIFSSTSTIIVFVCVCVCARARAHMDVAQLLRLPNGDPVVMGSTPTFHSGI